jgi:transcriptional regulator with XRE-family HTH domain
VIKNGHELRGAIKSLSMTGEQVAERLGISYATLWRQMNGKTPLKGPVAAAVDAWCALENILAAQSLPEAKNIAESVWL